ncbi:unnamed protein product [Urochloa humidicola]
MCRLHCRAQILLGRVVGHPCRLVPAHLRRRLAAADRSDPPDARPPGTRSSPPRCNAFAAARPGGSPPPSTDASPRFAARRRVGGTGVFAWRSVPSRWWYKRKGRGGAAAGSGNGDGRRRRRAA